MTSPKLCLALALAVSSAAGHAATDRHADAAISTPGGTLVAALGEPSVPLIPVTAIGDRVRPLSSGTAESLPDLPVSSLEPLRFNAAGEERAARSARRPSRITVVNVSLPDEPGMLSLVEASPIGGVARRMQAKRFNTDDSSSDDFAICYRLNSRSSLQVIPGDPAPVKIPVSSFANNAGVTVGMVVRLSR